MKVAYITTFDILESPPHEGGVVWSKRNVFLIEQVFGKENVHICAITKHKELLSKASGNTVAFFSDRRKINILKNCLSNRLQYNKNVESMVLEHIKSLQCDIVCLDMSRMGFLQKRLPKEIKQILFLCDIERDYIRDLVRINPSRFILKRAFDINENLSVKHSNIIIALNKRDADKLLGYYNRNPDLILPITMDDTYVEYDREEKPHPASKLKLLFVGALFPPNEHGLTWFINEVIPRIDAELVVVGKDFEKLRSKLQRSNVSIIGTVDGLSQYYHNADAVVAPIFLGAGMKVKTAGNLMYGKPMFATDEALEGYEVEGQKNVFRCNSSDEFISAINSFAANSPYIKFDADIRSLFLEKYKTARYIPIVRDLLLNTSTMRK